MVRRYLCEGSVLHTPHVRELEINRFIRGSSLVSVITFGRVYGGITGIIASEEISKQVIRVERWEGRRVNYGMGGDTEENGLFYFSVWATNGKDCGGEA